MGNDLTTISFASPSRQVRKIRKIVAHPYYNPTNFINDIAIVFVCTSIVDPIYLIGSADSFSNFIIVFSQLADPFEETKDFSPIQLPNKAIFDYQHCNVGMIHFISWIFDEVFFC